MKISEFIDKYYKPDRLDADPGRRERIIADREKDLQVYGEGVISRHDSVTGRTMFYLRGHQNMDQQTTCDKCDKPIDNDYSNFCNHCREEFNDQVVRERKERELENERFWKKRGGR